MGALAALLIGWGHRSDLLVGAGVMAITIVSARLASIDFREHRLPNEIVGKLALGLTAGVLVLGLRDGDLRRTRDAVIAGVLCCLVLFVFSLAGGIGMGDAKYGYCVAVALGWFGWTTAQVAILVTCASSALVALGILVTRSSQKQMAYGPYMVLGLLAGLAAAGTY